MKQAPAAILLFVILFSLLPIAAFAQASGSAPAGGSSAASGGAARAAAPGAGNLPVPFIDFNVRTARNNQ
jgi:hypothetical protein